MAVGLKCTVKTFLTLEEDYFVDVLTKYIESHELPVDPKQVMAWKDCFQFLTKQLSTFPNQILGATLLFEYMLPLEKGRRPDVVILLKDKVLILEFKGKSTLKEQDIEQAIGYKQDIYHFHSETVEQSLAVESFLVLTKAEEWKEERVCGLPILTSTNFSRVLAPLVTKAMDESQVERWINARYQPIPSIVEAAQDLFLKGELPYIKSIEEGDIAQAVQKIQQISHENELQKKKRIVFLSGVPGAGKTLVGLKTVYDYNLKRYQEEGKPLSAIYLSGNGPLVNVLQTQLSSGKVNGQEGKAYVRGMYSFKREYLETTAIPKEQVIVFDEAQRAWDAKQMKRPYSEAEALLRIGEKIYESYGYVTIVCLIGEGQAIHIGEEKGMKLWEAALKQAKDWEVYMPTHYYEKFQHIGQVAFEEALHLDTSIRTNFIDISKWIEAVLSGDLKKASSELVVLRSLGFKIRLMQDFEKIKKVMPKMKEIAPTSKYGLLVSSKASIFDAELKAYTGNTYRSSFVKDIYAGRWFMEDCEKLALAGSEFLCQGLEIDMPIVMFGGDYYLKQGKWEIDQCVESKYGTTYEDLGKIMENIYRVLLSRGRKGMILYIPPVDKFQETYGFFRKIGVPET